MTSPQTIRNVNSHQPFNDAELELLNADDRLQEEMQRLAAINQELLGKVRLDSKDAIAVPEEVDELTLLRGENAELRARVEEHALMPSSGKEVWTDRQKEYEDLMEEKSEVIRALYLKIQEMQEGGVAAAASGTDGSDMQRAKMEMAEQRSQLEADEESLMQQMRQMEMAMSKDRAELARQRSEIQRLHNELNHEIEIATRDPGLRERLVALQRLQGEITGRKQHATSPAPAQQPAETPATTKKQSSGLLRRIFGK